MIPPRMLICVGLTVLAPCASLLAQARRPAQVPFRRVDAGPGNRVRARRVVGEDGELRWDYAVLGRGTRRGSSPLGGSSGSLSHKALVNCFNNTITNGFFTAGTTGTEWVDWACKDAGKTDLVGAFAFGYASNARGLSEPGGTGATIGVSFFSGTSGFCTRGTRARTGAGKDAIFEFAGLPGATGSQISPGFSVTVILDGTDVFCLPDGEIGWSYLFLEPPRGMSQNMTGPLLTDLHTNTCWNDGYDIWSSPDPVASCAGVFLFGGCNPPTTFAVPPPCGSFWDQIFEETVVPGTSAAFNASLTPNPPRYAETRAANLGEPWETSVTLAPNPAGTEVAGLIRFGLPGTVIPGNGVGVAFLVNGSRLLLAGSATNLVAGGSGNPKVASVAIPKDVSLLGTSWNTQGFAALLSPPRLQALNGITITVGVQ